LPLDGARIIYNGINAGQFKIEDSDVLHDRRNGRLKLLYAGQIAKRKGVYTAIEAIEYLVNQRGIEEINLTILGTGHPEYEAHLKQFVIERRLRDFVMFRGQIQREEMPGLLRDFDVLVFPSVYEEPMARITQEAMATGLAVIATLTGGTKELIVDGQNGLIFESGDAKGLAAQVEKLIRDKDLLKRLSCSGRETIIQRFNIERTVKEIEEYLMELERGGKGQP
jgi:glycosyltransferase involved in cell wall biosynthesis